MFRTHHRSVSDLSSLNYPAIPRQIIELKPEPVKIRPNISIKNIELLTPLDVGKYLIEI